MSMIKLTIACVDSREPDAIHLKAEAIVSVRDRGTYREVMVESCFYGVKETPEEILALMDNQYLRQLPIVTVGKL